MFMHKICCPNCNQPYGVDDTIIGEKVECSICNTVFVARNKDDVIVLRRKHLKQLEPVDDRSARKTGSVKLVISLSVIAIILLLGMLFYFELKSENEVNSIQRVQKEMKLVIPKLPKNASLDDSFVMMLESFASYKFDFSGCPSDYVGLIIKLQNIYGEMALLVRDVNAYVAQKDNIQAQSIVEILAFGTSPSYNAAVQKTQDLETRVKQLISDADKTTSDINIFLNQRGISNEN